VRSYGTELTVRANATEHLLIGLSGGTTDATITDQLPALGITTGEHVLGVPEWTASISLKAHVQTDKLGDGFAQIDYNLVGPSSGTFDPTQVDYHRPATSCWD